MIFYFRLAVCFGFFVFGVLPANAENANAENASAENESPVRLSFFAFDGAMTRGVYSVSCDINGDGADDIVTTVGHGGPWKIAVHDGRSSHLLKLLTVPAEQVIIDPRLRCVELTGDGRPDIIFFLPGLEEQQRFVFSGTDFSPVASLKESTAEDQDKEAQAIADLAARKEKCGAYHQHWLEKLHLEEVDIDQDGMSEWICAAPREMPPLLTVYSDKEQTTIALHWVYMPAFLGGFQVTLGDTDADGFQDIITSAGRGGGPHIKVISGKTLLRNRPMAVYQQILAGSEEITVGSKVEREELELGTVYNSTGDSFAEMIQPSTDNRIEVLGKTFPGTDILTAHFLVKTGWVEILDEASGSVLRSRIIPPRLVESPRPSEPLGYQLSFASKSTKGVRYRIYGTGVRGVFVTPGHAFINERKSGLLDPHFELPDLRLSIDDSADGCLPVIYLSNEGGGRGLTENSKVRGMISDGGERKFTDWVVVPKSHAGRIPLYHFREIPSLETVVSIDPDDSYEEQNEFNNFVHILSKPCSVGSEAS